MLVSGRSESASGLVGAHVRRRSGVSIFIDNVSKRIHPNTLKEALKGYGVVTDTYIAYWNRSRRNNPTTFAFARFRSVREALEAVRKGNGSMMEGYRVNMFLAYQKEKRVLKGRSPAKNYLSRRGAWRDGA
ncbi:hypothetical protein HRI_002067100 [Hibiscus trionum]|uniref:RRM domain-containing protein n=1 Tax=Hibiscus trionum TaxID=183268 RepID=A0A9W7HWI0_HIBTR|nr:hypothetical protein HRI_002067100 [Hibiscus trionum]